MKKRKNSRGHSALKPQVRLSASPKLLLSTQERNCRKAWCGTKEQVSWPNSVHLSCKSSRCEKPPLTWLTSLGASWRQDSPQLSQNCAQVALVEHRIPQERFKKSRVSDTHLSPTTVVIMASSTKMVPSNSSRVLSSTCLRLTRIHSVITIKVWRKFWTTARYRSTTMNHWRPVLRRTCSRVAWRSTRQKVKYVRLSTQIAYWTQQDLTTQWASTEVRIWVST